MRARRRRDRGFSLLVVLMLITVMAGVAGTVILSTQQDLSLAGQDREALAAFYAAEGGVAQAKDWLAARLAAGGITPATFVAVGGWTPILGELAGAPEGCATGPLAATARRAWTRLDGNTRFTFCIHNDASDIAFLDPGGTTPPGCAGKRGDVCDERDPRHAITIEAWGASATTQAHVSVEVASPSLATIAWRQY
jgi:Tfp pilus assembly protein PilX